MRNALTLFPALALLVACTPGANLATSSPGRTSTLWPPEVVQALPSAIPDEAVMRDSDGCYSYRDPALPGGFGLVIGIDGRQLCDGRFPDPAEIEARAAAMRAEIAAGNANPADTPPAQ